MKFLRLHDPLLSVLFENEDIIAIDKPYGFNAHTNDSKLLHSESVEDGLIEIFEKNRGAKLHIIHRLDQTTTGVMIFGKSVESAKKYAEFFFNRQVKKTYLFLTKKSSVLKNLSIEKDIVHKGKNLTAQTDFSFVRSVGGVSLWQANPHTGRNHQIRIHAQSCGLSLLGDEIYKGDAFPFICLHNQKIEFPNGVVIQSRPPTYFENLEILSDHFCLLSLFEYDRRQRLFGESIQNSNLQWACLKGRAGENDLILEKWSSVLVANGGAKQVSLRMLENSKKLKEIFGRYVLTKHESELKVSIPNSELVKTNRELAIVDNEILYKYKDIELRKLLPLNQRLHRRWVQSESKNKSVLVLFASNGGYSINAAKGGAIEVASVDTNKTQLATIINQFELNEVSQLNHKTYLRDSLAFLEQCHLKSRRFDIIICDAPSYLKHDKKEFKLKNDIDRVLKGCLQLLNPKGKILFATSSDDFYIGELREHILKCQKSLKIENLSIDCVLPSLDFERPKEKVKLKSFIIQID